MIVRVVLALDDTFLIAICYNKPIKVFNLQTKQELHHFENNAYQSKEVDFHQENKIV